MEEVDEADSRRYVLEYRYRTVDKDVIRRRCIVGLLSAAEGIVSVSSEAIRMHTRGGLPMLNFRDKMACDMLSCDWERPGGSRVVVGHVTPKISIVDLPTCRIFQSVSANQGVSVIRSNGRLLACGGTGGELSLRDLRTARMEHTIDAHPGSIRSLDMKGDLVVTCGLVHRLGQVFCDPVVKVFDVRQVPRTLTHIPFHPGASILQFQPKFSSTLLVVAPSGAILLTDVQQSSNNMSYQNYQVDCGGDALLACDISSSGELLAFGDAGEYVHLWGSYEGARVNLFSMPTVLPDVVVRQVRVDENGPFTLPVLPVTNDVPFSNLDPTATIRVGLPPRIVDKVLLDQMIVNDFIGHVPNPHYRRGLPYGECSRAVAALRNMRLKRKTETGKTVSGSERRPPVGLLAPGSQKGTQPHKRLPKGYRRVEIKQSQSKFKFEEFDFSYYNKTRFAGLENDIMNSYCNALLQVLYFIPALREAVTSHMCEREFCLTCELGFVLHMLDLAEGDTCQPSNLLRALRQIREASALGLVEGPEEWDNSKEKSLAKRIQNFSRFLLEQLHKEAGVAAQGEPGNGVGPSISSITNQLFGITFRYRTKCLRVPHDDSLKQQRSFQVDLQYPMLRKGTPASFAAVLQRSLLRQDDMRAWCDQCRSYQHVQQMRIPSSLPDVLIINCCIRGEAELQFWQMDAQKPAAVPKEDKGAKKGVSPVKGKDDGSGGGGAAAGASGRGGWPAASPPDHHWLPFTVTINLNPDSSQITVTEDRTGGISNEENEMFQQQPVGHATDQANSLEGGIRAVYELTAMIVHIREDGDDSEGNDGHLVSHIRIPYSYIEAHGGSVSASTSQATGPPAGAVHVVPPTNYRSLSRGGSPSPGSGTVSGPTTASPQSANQGLSMGQGGSTGAAAGAFGNAKPGASFSQVIQHPSRAGAAAAVGGAAGGGGAVGANSSPAEGERERSPGLSRNDSLSSSAGPAGPWGDWVLFNDFCITPTSALEVVATYGKQKVPCLLYYSQVECTPVNQTMPSSPPPTRTFQLAGAASPMTPMATLPAPGLSLTMTPISTPVKGSSVPTEALSMAMSPSISSDCNPGLASAPARVSATLMSSPGVLMPSPSKGPPNSPIPEETFWRLMLEGSSPVRHGRANEEVPRTFLPLDPLNEAPYPRMLLGIDAEFVALSPAEKGTREDGSEFIKRPARLGLARISVVRGEGPKAGVCCIDDYIRTVEPVYDYLTRYSGLVHGDLDPSVSKHHITTLKAAYLKLRYLVDKGCRFIGHGLKKDFRIINIVVPSDQIIDTVELFNFKRQRKLSLRFLASYLLNLDIQKETHDSIEDARTALKLYEKYKQLVATGEFHNKLLEIYKYGRRHGWETVSDGSVSSIPPLNAAATAEGSDLGQEIIASHVPHVTPS
ncbi:hypothetical protein CBR_g49959 [Chara braunii]|uniref:USP domain-containing protein n=1 Tax=Chara braunii TaxID=69332 RepID=A0A388K5E1_CHABU|nr:hypothetical protein CBR_g49959 [Chara braunii]|eukprot:GBG65163.1 hypothetical protein CBR_g49959 [Chara braunii]